MSVLPNIKVVLVEPLYSGNVGSACRAMANMGLKNLTLVAPKIVDGWEEGERLACHAKNILEQRQTVQTLPEAVADCAAVVGTTARLGLYRQHVRMPREVAPELVRIAANGNVALVFGREDKGLSNEEVSFCTHLVRIPTADTYVSLNLAQAVMVCSYELFLACDHYEEPQEKSALAPAAHRIKLMEMWRLMLLKIGYMNDEKADHMMQGFQRIFTRGAVTEDDIHILMGVARQVGWAAGKQALPPRENPTLPGNP